MKKLILSLILVFALISAASAFALPTAIPLGTDTGDISVAEADFDAPEAGEWLSYALALEDNESSAGSLRFHFADTASELGYNDYETMQPQEKAVTVYAMFNSNFSYEGAMLFADDGIESDTIPLCTVPAGNYALFVYDGSWTFDSAFALKSVDETSMSFSLTFEGLEGKPALAAKESENGWIVVGVNKDLLDEITKIAFQM